MYTRRLCTHPRLVQDEKSSDWRSAMSNFGRASLDELKVSEKMQALKQLLEELDVGGGGEARHRCLIFAQLKQTLDIIEHDVLGRHLPNLSFKRLDGTVPANDRFAVQKTFNSDTSIDLLLLTTSIGGLGLNLTGADTVIFVEHDWNPSKDLQVLALAPTFPCSRAAVVCALASHPPAALSLRVLVLPRACSHARATRRWTGRIA
jgi:TATA-binding protein-associated factor